MSQTYTPISRSTISISIAISASHLSISASRSDLSISIRSHTRFYSININCTSGSLTYGWCIRQKRRLMVSWCDYLRTVSLFSICFLYFFLFFLFFFIMFACLADIVHSLCGFPPFYGKSQAQLFEKILNADFDFPEPEWTQISAEGIPPRPLSYLLPLPSLFDSKTDAII